MLMPGDHAKVEWSGAQVRSMPEALKGSERSDEALTAPSTARKFARDGRQRPFEPLCDATRKVISCTRCLGVSTDATSSVTITVSCESCEPISQVDTLTPRSGHGANSARVVA